MALIANDDDLIILRALHSDNDEHLAKFEGSQIPIPEVGETVSFGEMDVVAESADGGKDASFNGGEETFVVVERGFGYFNSEVEVKDSNTKGKIVVSEVRLHVLPVDEWEARQD